MDPGMVTFIIENCATVLERRGGPFYPGPSPLKILVYDRNENGPRLLNLKKHFDTEESALTYDKSG